MDYPCAKFSDFCFSRLGFIVRTNRHTESRTPLNCRRRKYTQKLQPLREGYSHGQLRTIPCPAIFINKSAN